jgi:proteasome regulatory subunit
MSRGKATNNTAIDGSDDLGTPDIEDSKEFISIKKENERLNVSIENFKEEINSYEVKLSQVKAERDRYKKKIIQMQQTIKQISTPPLVIGTVEAILKGEERRAVVKIANGQSFISPYPYDLEPKPGDTVGLTQNSMLIAEILPNISDSMAETMIVDSKPTETYNDVGGLEEQLLEVREAVELPLLNPELFSGFGIIPPSGILLHGPPGTGKTLIAKAVANATNATFISIVASELVQKFIGEGARLVREVFKLARQKAPVIVFIDEIDAIAAKRTEDGQTGEREINRTLMQLLAEMDGFRTNKGNNIADPALSKVKIIATTNRIDILDPAILRPGRFDRIIELPLPDYESRLKILNIHSNKIPKYGVKMEEIATLTEGMSGADLKSICNEAAMFAIREKMQGVSRNRILHKDFLAAVQKVKNKKMGNVMDNNNQGIYA